MSPRTTVNGQTARCSIEVPLEAIGAASYNDSVDDTQDRNKTFTTEAATTAHTTACATASNTYFDINFRDCTGHNVHFRVPSKHDLQKVI